MSARSAVVIICDWLDCDTTIIPMGVADDNASRSDAREFARMHGWVTADRSPSATDLCPEHAAPNLLWRSSADARNVTANGAPADR